MSLDSEDITVEDIPSGQYEFPDNVPEPVVKHGTKVLVKGTDYELSYSGDADVANTGKVIITGKGNYKDSIEKTFGIDKKSITEDMVQLSALEFTYNGSVQKPEVTVADGNLMTAEDYQITNNGGTNAGEYEVTVKATENGNYSGSVTKKYKIVPKALTADMISITSAPVVFFMR
jgi:hypothetical protein